LRKIFRKEIVAASRETNCGAHYGAKHDDVPSGSNDRRWRSRCKFATEVREKTRQGAIIVYCSFPRLSRLPWQDPSRCPRTPVPEG
jgi:hypothetical protein